MNRIVKSVLGIGAVLMTLGATSFSASAHPYSVLDFPNHIKYPDHIYYPHHVYKHQLMMQYGYFGYPNSLSSATHNSMKITKTPYYLDTSISK